PGATSQRVTTAAGSLDFILEGSDATGLSAALAPAPSATDICTISPRLTPITALFPYTTLFRSAYVRVRTWNFADGCANTSANFSSEVQTSDITTPLVITSARSLDDTLECSDTTGLTAALALAPAATDNCTASPLLNLVSDLTTP